MNVKLLVVNGYNKRNLITRLDHNNVDFIFVSEHNSNENDLSLFSGQRICIKWSDEWKVEDKILLHENLMTLIVRKGNCRLRLIGIYAPPRKHDAIFALINYLEKASERISTFIAGDVNVETLIWTNELRRHNNIDSKSREAFERILACKNYRPLLPKSKPACLTRMVSGSGSAIDICLYNGKVRHNLTKVVSMEGLDHMIISVDCRIGYSKSLEEPKIPIYGNDYMEVGSDINTTMKNLMSLGCPLRWKVKQSGNRRTRRLKYKLKQADEKERKGLIGKLRQSREKSKTVRYWRMTNDELYSCIKSLELQMMHRNPLNKTKLNLTFLEGSSLEVDNTKEGLTSEELQMIEKLKFKTSSGLADNFTVSRWNRIWIKNRAKIINLVDDIMKTGHIPPSLNLSGGTKIPKKDGGFRIVRTQSFLGKIIDKVLLERVKKCTLEGINQEYQFAYLGRKRMEFLYTIYKFKDEYKFMVKMDLSKAFDKVSRSAIKDRLMMMEDEDEILIKEFTMERRVRMMEDGKLIIKKDPESLQGFALGPFLFVLAIDSTLREINSFSAHKAIAYADDLVVLTDNVKSSQLMMQRLFAKINLEFNHAFDHFGLEPWVENNLYIYTIDTFLIAGRRLTNSLTSDNRYKNWWSEWAHGMPNPAMNYICNLIYDLWEAGERGNKFPIVKWARDILEESELTSELMPISCDCFIVIS